jgi:isoquinoline 1-oxidoreductase
MNKDILHKIEPNMSELSDEPRYEVVISRRSFIKLLGAGLLITVTSPVSFGQRRRERASISVAARLHLNEDGVITVMTGKVEEGQGPRTQLTQAAAEELRVDVGQIRLVMADSALVPDDGRTAGSRTTPSTVPAVRRGAATARELLTRLAAEKWKVDASGLEVRKGIITDRATKQSISYADLAKSAEVDKVFQESKVGDVDLTPASEWQSLGQSIDRPNNQDLVTGAHKFPSDIMRDEMLYGKILRPPSYGATLESIDLSEARAMKDVVVVRDGEFVGCAAPTSFEANRALEVIAKTASWKTRDGQPSSKDIFAYLKENAEEDRRASRDSIEKAFADAKKVLSETYEVSYIQHTPMEPRAAIAEWKDGKLTVWAGVDYPHGLQEELAEELGMPAEQIRAIIPDMGGGFGGKHSGEAAVEAARLAKAAKRPVAVHWTRAEEFTWAYFRPAAVIECKSGLDGSGNVIAWEFTNINAGGSAIEPPYEIENVKVRDVESDSPLRQGAYRCLAATANNFARESFIDELAAAAGVDELEFRLAHLENPRIRKVLETAAKYFRWEKRRKNVTEDIGVGLACGTEKNSVVAACVEVSIDRKLGQIKVNEICQYKIQRT